MESSNSGNASGLSAAELGFLRERLERARSELLTRVGREEDLAREPEDEIEDVDLAEQVREQGDAVTFSQRDRELLDDIERALSKFTTGRYGLSEISGEAIGFRRLEAVPWARETADEADAP